jgi:RHS repeat-associated protein
VYNYYGSLGNVSSCIIPSQGTGNNGNVVGYWYNDNTNTSLSHSATYGYDNLNRLTGAAATGSSTYSLGFGYDRWGNMNCTGGDGGGSANGPCPAWTFNSNNQINTSGFTYDAAGDLLQDPSTSPTSTYQWDAEGRLSKVTQNGTTYSTFTYNAFGQPVEGFYPGYNLKVDALFDPYGQELGYYDATTGSWFDRDIHLGGRMVAQSYASATYFLHANALGSDTQITDQGGAVKTDWVYYPWEPWEYLGNEVDAHFAGFEQSGGPNYPTPFRRYSGAQGRWLSPDPLAGDVSNPQSLNRYAYVLNNPTTLTDPLGLQSDPCERNPNRLICGNDAFPHPQPPGIFAPGLDEFDLALLGLLPGTATPTGLCPAQFQSCVQTPGGLIGFNNAGVGTPFGFDPETGAVVTQTINGVVFVNQSFFDNLGTNLGTAYGNALGFLGKFFRGRPPGVSFGACMAQNVNLLTTGSANKSITRFVGLGATGIAGAALGLLQIGTASGPTTLTQLLTYVGAYYTNATIAQAVAAGAVANEAALGVAAIGLAPLVGSAANCASVGVAP